MHVLVTGVAGFIGFHVAKRLLERGDSVVGIDNLNDYYDPLLKLARLAELGVWGQGNIGSSEQGKTVKEGGGLSAFDDGKPIQSSLYPAFQFRFLDLADRKAVETLFREESFDVVCHLAAQAGVRYSITNPMAYVTSNLVGFAHLLEGVRNPKERKVRHFVYASSSSVYGLNTRKPFRTSDTVDHPVSFYAATKKSNELMAHAYSHLFGIPTTGLRFFTVYGPWGRPDMAYFLFTQSILEGRPITINNFGNMQRDFTYIDDIVEGVIRVLDKPATPNPEWNGEDPDPASSPAPYRVYNIGFGNPAGLMDLVEAIETELGRKAEKILKPMPAGDVPVTYADTTDLERDFGYRPRVDIRTGIREFVKWYRSFYGEA
ncbi:MAG: NAD-dependent epimerase [Spirochaetes bacterium]|nr:NAD-dependent epimerase [Spirochaetota bacterium]